MLLQRVPGRPLAERNDGDAAVAESSWWISTGSFERGALRADAVEQILPGLDERFGSFALQIGGELFIVDTGLSKGGDYTLGIAAILGRTSPSAP